MCCFPVSDVFLEDPPPEKEEKEEKKEKKEEKVKKNYVLVSDQLNLQPIVSQQPVSAPHFLPLSLPFTKSHIITHHILSPPTTSINRVSLSSYHFRRPFRNGFQHEPAIYLPSWRRENSSACCHQCPAKYSTLDFIHPAVKRMESLDKPSCRGFQHKSPPRLPASLF